MVQSVEVERTGNSVRSSVEIAGRPHSQGGQGARVVLAVSVVDLFFRSTGSSSSVGLGARGHFKVSFVHPADPSSACVLAWCESRPRLQSTTQTAARSTSVRTSVRGVIHKSRLGSYYKIPSRRH